MQLYYANNISERRTITLDENESHHLSKVLRMKPGDSIHLCDGKGSLYLSEIKHIGKKNVQVLVIKRITFEEDNENYLHIAIAPTKNISRLEWFLEKATEIGVAEISPILCDNSERNRIREDRLEKIIIGAMKQSKRLYKPILNPLRKFQDIINSSESQKFIAYCEDIPDKQLINELNPDSPAIILIGPEGDFSQNELELAVNNNFSPIALGEFRLRTETAGIVSCQIAQDVYLRN